MSTYAAHNYSTTVNKPCQHWTTHEFVELRDMAHCRLTLCNEPARLNMSNWLDVKNDVWLNKDHLSHMTESKRMYFDERKVMYQSGKGITWCRS